MAQPAEPTGAQVGLEAADAVGAHDGVVRGPGRQVQPIAAASSTVAPSSGRPNRIDPDAHTRTLS